jgi:hypothetical protein
MRYKVFCISAFICIYSFLAGLSQAQTNLRVSESATRIQFQSDEISVDLSIKNDSRAKITAHFLLELVDPQGAVRSHAEGDVPLPPGISRQKIVLPLVTFPEKDPVRISLLWYRLRYTINTVASVGPREKPLEGVISVSEAAPQFFELHVAAPETVKAGGHYVLHVRAIHPVSGHPQKGVAVQASLDPDPDDDKPLLTGIAITDSEGFATLEFSLPKEIDPEGVDVTVSGTRGNFSAKADDTLRVDNSLSSWLSTDKPLYQPGQTLHLRLLVFEENKKALANQKVTFDITDPERTLVNRTSAQTSRFGIASADWQIPENLRLGTYLIKASFDEDGPYTDSNPMANVKISRYDLPTFVVTAKPDRNYYLPGQNASVEVRADYIFGELVRRGHIRVVRETERHWNYREQKYDIEEAEQYEGDTDDRGRFTTQIDLTKIHEQLEADRDRLNDISFTAYFTDSSTGKTEERRFALRVTRDPIQVYAVLNELPKSGRIPDFYVTTSYADGSPAECEIEMNLQRKSSAKNNNSMLAVNLPLRHFRTNHFGVAKVSGVLVPAGDSDMDEVSLSFVAKDHRSARGFDTAILSSDDRSLLFIATDKALYSEGEPIAIDLTSIRFENLAVVDVVHEGKVVSSQAVRFHNGHAGLVFAPHEGFQGELTIFAYAFGIHPETNSSDSYFYARHTILFPKNRDLNLNIRFRKTTYQPGQQAEADLRVVGPFGEHTKSALGLVVVDRAVEERERTDQDLVGAWGFFGSQISEGPEELGGVKRSDLDKVDLSKPLPEGYDLVAEILLQHDWREPNFFGSGSRNWDLHTLFARELANQVEPVRTALIDHYNRTAEYPKTESDLLRMLSEEGIDLKALRDPWGLPFHAEFGVESYLDVLQVSSSGPDKKIGTDDDVPVLKMQWAYFKNYSEAITRAITEYHARTGKYIRDAQTFKSELSLQQIDFDAVKDHWSHPYQLSFGIQGTRYTVTIKSAGPDGRFDTPEKKSYDDFALDTIGIDYFADTRLQIDKALAEQLGQTQSFPENIDQLRVALRNAGMNWDSLKDPWGHPFYAVFRREARYSDDIIVESFEGASEQTVQHKNVTPVTQHINWLYIRSAGEDGVEGTSDDFDIATFSRAVVKQDSQSKVRVPITGQTVMLGGTGVISGRVFDPSGAVIVGAEVSAKNNRTADIFTGKTDDDGIYILRGVLTGIYVVQVSMAGFRSSAIVDVPVLSGNTTSVNAKLEVGTATQTIEVNSTGGELQTLNSEVSSIVSKRQIASLPLAGSQITTPRLRQYFPETLFWQPELITDSTGHAQLKFPLADNITTWKLSAIASNERGEIGTAEKEIRAFQSFFVEHDPPRFLTAGDEISLPVVLRNYLERKLQMNVEMKPESWFNPMSPAEVKIEVLPRDSASQIFQFRAVTPIREGKQRVIASGAGAGDAIERTVTVRPDGEEKTQSVSQIFNEAATLILQIPETALPGSFDGTLKIYPNLNSHLLESIEAILERPHGCAEQTISSTYPSVLLLEYAQDADKEPSPLIKKARHFVQLGYERLLSYHAPDGGFTYWGRGDSDLALTAYALRFLMDAGRFIDVDNSIASEALTWLLKQIQPDGHWISPYWNGKEDSHRSAMLTAYIARTISSLKPKSSDSIADKKLEEMASLAVKRAFDYLAPQVHAVDEPYLIASYVLAASSTRDTGTAAESLVRLRNLEHREGDTSYWSLETNTPFYGWGLAGRIETTALVLQALQTGGAATGMSSEDDDLISRGLLFLLRNQDRFGIWYSTQATINVLDALGSLTSRKTSASYLPVNNSIGAGRAAILLDGREILSLDLPPSNELTAPITADLSKYLSPGNHQVEVRRAPESARASTQLVASYYVPWMRPKIGSDLHLEPTMSDALRLSVSFDKESAAVGESVQCTVDAERVGYRGYGMMLAEIGLPPGADVDRATLERAMKESGWRINQYDVLPDRLVVYLWPHAGGTKFTFSFKPRFGLKAQTAPSILYDYYNPEARAVVAPKHFIVQ